MNVILVEPGEVGEGGRVVLEGARARHVSAVIGAEAGRSLRVGVVDGPFGVGVVVAAIEGERVALVCSFDAEPPAIPPVDVLMAVPRPKVLRRLWAQMAALGVGRIILTNAERVERNYFDTHVLGAATYRSLLIEGLTQARDTRVPVVTVHRQFRKLVEDELDGLSRDTLRIVGHPGGGEGVSAALRSRGGRRVLVAIGPEGGWNGFELTMLESRGFTPRVLARVRCAVTRRWWPCCRSCTPLSDSWYSSSLTRLL